MANRNIVPLLEQRLINMIQLLVIYQAKNSTQ